MKTIIAGSRCINDPNLVHLAMGEFQSLHGKPIEIVSGGALGIDSLAVGWARLNGIPEKVFKADWFRGRQAGFERNVRMAEYADSLVAIWDGRSLGTRHMIETMEKLGKIVLVRKPISLEFPLFS